MLRKQIKRGLTSDVVTMSYGGLLEEIKDEAVMIKFREFCKKHHIKTMLSMMSITGAINLLTWQYKFSGRTTEISEKN